jgi:hypothetical protein
MKHVVKLWLLLQEWDRLVEKPFTNCERLMEIEALMGVPLVELFRRPR